MNAGINEDLLGLSHELGSTANDWAILGEGNASARIDDERFLVKASGASMGTLAPDQLVEVRFAPLLEALRRGASLGDAETKQLLLGAADLSPNPSPPQREVKVDGGRTPSVETVFHAMLLQLPGVSFVGHTHVTSINGLLCSKDGWELIKTGGRTFPDEVVVCGVASCCVPYVDPGLPLALAIGESVDGYRERYGAVPKTIYLQNHGFIALGASSREVIAVTRMADKAARIMLSTMQAGGPRFLTDDIVARIATRPDEHHRQRELGLRGK